MLALCALCLTVLSGCGGAPRADYCFVNGVRAESTNKSPRTHDIKTVTAQEDGALRFVNYPEGYTLDFPAGTQFDCSLCQLLVQADTPDYSVTVSCERSPYEDVEGYIDYYQNRFYTHEGFRAANGLNLLCDETFDVGGLRCDLLALERPGAENGLPKVYAYAYLYTGGQNYMRFLFRGAQADDAFLPRCRALLETYRSSEPVGFSYSHREAEPHLPAQWDEPTRALYRHYLESDGVDFGIFSSPLQVNVDEGELLSLEERLDYRFEISLIYSQLHMPFPMAAMEKAAELGKTVELTIQVSAQNNEDIFGYTPMFDLADGRLDGQIRALAQNIKAFGRPLLFRLNNEMNSDWTSYSGIVTLGDPELYRSVWQRFYRIFEQEGVTNAIWVFNPNDNNYPPNKWNNFLCYYPGDEYVQMIGLTGYNTGTYYNAETGEVWRSFERIYRALSHSYEPVFGNFPWIITEFSSSSFGGDKARWITEMFADLKTFPNIKAAVWFHYADFDTRPGREGTAARPYWLDETPETLEAFRRGLAGLQG